MGAVVTSAEPVGVGGGQSGGEDFFYHGLDVVRDKAQLQKPFLSGPR